MSENVAKTLRHDSVAKLVVNTAEDETRKGPEKGSI